MQEKIKLICFDFDGVLCKLKEAHYLSLNKAIEEIAGSKFIISLDEHTNIYDGLSTLTKLKKLVKDKKLLEELIPEINKLKQKYTIQAIEEVITPNTQLQQDLKQLKSEGYLLYCCSNAIRATVEAGLKKLGIFELFDSILSNEDVKNQKPSSEIYLKAFIQAGVDPKQTLIVEDSKHGKDSAARSGAYVCDVDNETETTYDTIKRSIDFANSYSVNTKYPVRNKLVVAIPMSGAGSRFAAQPDKYPLPKPLLNVRGKTMVQMVIDNLNVDAEFVFIVQKEHCHKYNLDIILPLISPDCKIVQVDKLTEGAACSVLLAKDYINNDKHLLVANSDQFIDWNGASDFLYSMVSQNADGGILTFERENDPKWSYVKTNEKGDVVAVAEKQVISNLASIGIYYWKHGSDFVASAEEMIKYKLKVNGEYYVCPTYNILINKGKKIRTFDIDKDKFYGTGVPEDLEYFLANYKGKI
jgi:HAD superfamily hydrolase (TIGR01509 family)